MTMKLEASVLLEASEDSTDPPFTNITIDTKKIISILAIPLPYNPLRLAAARIRIRIRIFKMIIIHKEIEI